MNDQSLGDSTPDQTPPDGGVFARNETPDIDLASLGRQLTVAQILEMAKVPEKRASICLRSDLQARYDELLEQLSGLVSARGELLEDAEASMGEATAASKARGINDEITAVRAEMAKSMWRPLFRGMSSDDLAVFNKAHYPDKQGADLTDYNNRLIAACAAEPEMSVADVQALRKSLNFKAVRELVQTATEVCVGGIDVPKLPSFSVAPKEQ